MKALRYERGTQIASAKRNNNRIGRRETGVEKDNRNGIDGLGRYGVKQIQQHILAGPVAGGVITS